MATEEDFFNEQGICFGFVTNGQADKMLAQCVVSAMNSSIQNKEVIIVGHTKLTTNHAGIRIIPFGEKLLEGWITKKKNIITESTSKGVVVYSHDYIAFARDWFEGLVSYGPSFEILTNRILNVDRSRFRDWTLWWENKCPDFDKNLVEDADGLRPCLLPYSILHLTDKMYISGAYWVAKRTFMECNPLSESLVWGQGEDVEWSLRVRKLTKFRLNPFSSNISLKPKWVGMREPSAEELSRILYNS
jgi:hypothetical protein